MARRLFFYGTLRDAETRDIVLGPYRDAVTVREAVLPDHAVRAVQGEDYPVILREAGAEATGIVLDGLPEEAVARLNFFEDEFDYELAEAEARTDAGPMPVEVFYVRGAHLKTDGAWDFGAWQATQQRAFAEAAVELMDLYGQVPPEQVDKIWPGIRFRAYARARAHAETDVVKLRSKLTRADVQMEPVERPYVDYYAVEFHKVTHPTFSGKTMGPLDRAIFCTGDAVCLLPYDPKSDTVLMLEQFRVGALARGAKVPWTIETVAGRIDTIESAEETARREAREEAGLEIGRVVQLPSHYTSPGTLAEKMTCFIGEADLSGGGGLHGAEDEDEDIRTLILTVEEAKAAWESGEIENGPLLLNLLYLFMHHDRLRAEWG